MTTEPLSLSSGGGIMWLNILRPYLPWLGGGVVLVVGWCLFGNPFATHATPHENVTEESTDLPTEVHLSEAKRKAVSLQFAKVEKRPIQPMRMVPASVTYDASKHLTLTSPVAAIVRKILVQPGDVVAAGTELAILSSSEIGQVRDEVARHEDDLKLMKQQLEWSEQVITNVEQLLTSLEDRPKLIDIEKLWKDKLLGDHRDKLLSAYSRLVLAESMTADLDTVAAQGSLSQRTIQERRSVREIAQASFQALCETSRFAAKKEHVTQLAEVRHAERQLRISQDRLANLLGPHAAVSEMAGEGASEFVVRAPFAGRIEERHTVAASRLAAGDQLFDLADVSTLWISAEIHERDWAALSVAGRSELQIQIPALEGTVLMAPYRFAGARVSRESRSVPLVAEVDNSAGTLRPGMFAWAQVPLATSRDALVVPAGAIMRHQSQPFVFVPKSDHEFLRVDVRVGIETQGMIEIIEGLEEGTSIVSDGTFILKSELLLEREE